MCLRVESPPHSPMNLRSLITGFLLAASSAVFSQTIITTEGYSSGVSVNAFGGAGSTYYRGKGVMMSFPNRTCGVRLDLPAGTNWSAYTHLQVIVTNPSRVPQLFFFAVASTGLWCHTEVLLTPGPENKIIIPLDGSPVGNVQRPQPVNNDGAQVFAGSFVDKPNVKWLIVQTPQQTSAAQVLIKDMKPVNAQVPSTAFIDKYGQQASNTWPGKITTDADLATAVNARTLSGVPPYPADLYGGVAGTAGQSTNTGKWHTEKQNGKWYLIDPLGNRFFSAGAITAGGSNPAIVSGRESAFVTGALPPQAGSFAEHYETSSYGIGVPTLTYNFYTANLQRRLGSNWRALHTNVTLSRMKTWGLNTGGDATNFDVRVSGQLPFTEVAHVYGSFSTLWISASGAALPDVFDPNWAPAVKSSLTTAVNMHRGNRMFIGLFVDNEQPWAYPYGVQNERYGLAQSILAAPASQPAKVRFINWLKQKYGNNIVSLNLAWLTNLATFDLLLNGTFQLPATITGGMATDLQQFQLLYARTYYSTIKQKLGELGFDALYLGNRLRFYSPETLQAAQESCDIVSFNAYDAVPTNNHADVKALDAPVMISEVGIGACDLGRISWYPNLLSENDRAWYFKRYMADALTFPNLVGLHYYKWEDDVASGRFFDGYNSSMGLVSIADVPYWPMVDAITAGNTALHNRLLTP